jgi:ADP-ribosylglycohydrolase
MRLAPVPVYFRDDPERAIAFAAESSRTTHGAQTAVDACRYFAGLIVGALQGLPKQQLLVERFHPVRGQWLRGELHPEIDLVAAGSFLRREPPEIRGTGFVVQSLEAAMWAFARSDDFRTGALLAVNLGDDADTTGAIYGQLAGTHYGVDGIPAHWVAALAKGDQVQQLTSRLITERG